MIIGLGANPLEGYKELLIGAFGGTEELAESAAKAMPLLLVGTGICVAFRAKVINIGGEGQIIAGGLLSTMTALAVPDLPSVVLIPLVLLMGLVGGAIWGGIPGALKAYLGVNEILTTIMLNLVAVKLFDYLVRAPLMDPKQIELGTRIPQTKRLSENADLPVLIAGTRLHLGVVVALLAEAGARRRACLHPRGAHARRRHRQLQRVRESHDAGPRRVPVLPTRRCCGPTRSGPTARTSWRSTRSRRPTCPPPRARCRGATSRS